MTIDVTHKRVCRLSVEEHLWFYSRLKGMDNESIKREMPGMIQDIGLPHKRHEMAKNLSGWLRVSSLNI